MIGLIENGLYWEADADIVSEFEYDADGVPVRKIRGPETVPLRPSPDHEWDGTAWNEKTLTLADVKAREVAQAEAKAARRLGRLDDAIRRVVYAQATAGIPRPADVAALKKANDIEAARDAAVVAINAATTRAAARDVVGKIVWP